MAEVLRRPPRSPASTATAIKANRGTAPLVVPVPRRGRRRRLRHRLALRAAHRDRHPVRQARRPHRARARRRASPGRLDDYVVNPSGGPHAPDRQARGQCVTRGPAARARRGAAASRSTPTPTTAARARCCSRSRRPPTRAATRTRRTRPTATPRCSRSRCRSATTPPSSTCPDDHDPHLGGPGLRPRHRRRCAPCGPSDPADADDLTYEGSFTQARRRGLASPATAARCCGSAAADDATEGGDRRPVRDGRRQQRRRRSASASTTRRRPSLLPIRVDDMEAGQSRDLRPGAPTSSRASPAPTPRSCPSTRSAARGCRPASSGSSVTFKAGPDAQGTSTFRIVMSDVADSDSPRAHGRGPDPVRGAAAPRARPARRVPTRRRSPTRSRWAGSRPRTTAASPITDYRSRSSAPASRSPAAPTSATSAASRTRRPTRSRSRAVNKVGQGDWSDVSQVGVRRHGARTRREHPHEGARRPHDHHRLGPADDRDLQGRSATTSAGSAPSRRRCPAPRPPWWRATSTTTPSTPSRSRRSTRSTTPRRARPSRSSRSGPRCPPGRRR